MLVLGWWLIPITLYHLIPLSLDSLSWRELFPRSGRPSVLRFVRMRWIRESINSLLPVAGVGGDIVGARLVHQRGVSGVQAAASTVVDITVGAATQVVFVVAGVTAVATRESAHASPAIAQALFIGAAVFAAAIGAFVLVQHNSMFGLFAKTARRLAPMNWLSGFSVRAEAIDDAVVATYRRRFALTRAALLRFAGWVTGAGEIWLATHVLGKPLSVIDALVLESLVSGVRGAAFMVPEALGAQEGGLVLFGALFGLPADLALAISLTKRVRELALGLPGLTVWQWGEGRRWFSRRADKARSAPQ